MAITYSWEILDLRVQYSSNSLANVVNAVAWQYNGESGSGASEPEYHSHVNNMVWLGSVPSADFVAYESLTEAKVLGWVTSSLFAEHGDDYIETMQTKISGSIAEQLHPVEGSKLKPW